MVKALDCSGWEIGEEQTGALSRPEPMADELRALQKEKDSPRSSARDAAIASESERAPGACGFIELMDIIIRRVQSWRVAVICMLADVQ